MIDDDGAAAWSNELLGFSNEILMVVDSETRIIVSASPWACECLGYPLGALQGMAISEIEVSIADVFYWEEVAQGHVREVSKVAGIYRRNDGSEIPVLKDVRKTERGSHAFLVVRARDNREGHLREEMLESLTSLLQATLEATGDGVLVLNEGGNVVNMNRRLVEVWQIPEHVYASGGPVILSWMSGQVMNYPSAFPEGLFHLESYSPRNKIELTLKGNRYLECRVQAQRVGGVVVGRIYSFHDVSQNKQAEERLIKEYQYREKIIQSLPGIFYVFDGDGKFQEWNRNLEDLTGRSSEEMTVTHPLDLFDGDDKFHIANAITRGFKDGIVTVEAALRDKNGRHIPYFFSGAMCDVDSRSLLIGLGVDISERKLVEQKVMHERTRLATILRMASDGIHVLDAAGYLVNANEAFLRMLGYDQSVIGHIHISEWDIDHDWETNRRRNESLIFQQLSSVFEARYRCRDNSIISVEISACGIEIDGQSLLYAASRDITQRKKGESQLRLAASVFSNSEEGILITDADNRIVDVNSAFSRISGYSRSEVLNKKPEILRSSRQGKPFYKDMWQVLNTDGHWQGELWNKRKNGELFAVRLTITAVHDEGGHLAHYVAIMSDITEVRSYQEKLEKLAYNDSLTGIPNRALFFDRIHQAVAYAQRNQTIMVVGYLDLDEFKPINDTYGHQAGDEVLTQVAKRLRESIRGGDTAARLGGDEFAFLLLGIEGIEECHLALRRIQNKIAAPMEIKGITVSISASIGATLCPTDSSDVDVLLRHADQAMYAAKDAGKNCIHLYVGSEQGESIQ
ncbi:MAG TPA: PAS domain S-box protein [Rhodocyclaceae bacterium]